jgi:phosphoglycolate phosphatase
VSSSALPARAALFDLDGTLLDTAPDMIGALNSLLAEEQRAALGFAGLRSQVSHGAIALVRAGFPDATGAAFELLRQRFLQLYSQRLAEQTRLFPGFEALLLGFEARRLPWGVVTNKPGWLTEPLLEALGLRRRAGCVISGDTLPERKPHPRPLLVAAAELGVSPAHCLYVGDALRDVQAGVAAGMVTIGARYGYVDAADDPDHWPVAGWISAAEELLPWVGLPPLAASA